MDKRTKEFLEKLADLMEEYKVEMEQNYEMVSYTSIKSYLDFDFQESPYDSVHITDVYIDSEGIRRLVLNES